MKEVYLEKGQLAAVKGHDLDLLYFVKRGKVAV